MNKEKGSYLLLSPKKEKKKILPKCRNKNCNKKRIENNLYCKACKEKLRRNMMKIIMSNKEIKNNE
jgi:hypothetical protein